MRRDNSRQLKLHTSTTDYRLPAPLLPAAMNGTGEQFLSQTLLSLSATTLSYYPKIAPFTNTANLSNIAFSTFNRQFWQYRRFWQFNHCFDLLRYCSITASILSFVKFS